MPPEATATEESSIRDTLETTFDVIEETGAMPEDTSTPPTETSTPPAETSTPPADTSNPRSEAPPAGETAEEKAKREYLRDNAGKFATKEEAEKAAAAAAKAQTEAGKGEGKDITPGPRPGPKDPTERAPQSWKPAAREHWANIPKEAREEIARRETEVQSVLKETAEARRYADAVQKTIAPYQQFIKAEGANDFQAIDNMMAAAAKLRTGTGPELAQFVSAIINQYGVGRFGPTFISQLDNALAGVAPSPADMQQQAMQQAMQQQFAPLYQMQNQMLEQQRQQQFASEQAGMNDVQQFINAEKPEFFNDVRMQMADIMDMGEANGVQYTLKQAYDIACQAHPEIRQVLQQRQQQEIAGRMTDAAHKAKLAAASVGGSPAPGANNPVPENLRDQIAFAMNQNSR